MRGNPIWRRMPLGGRLVARLGLAVFFVSVALNLAFAARDPHWAMLPAVLVAWYLTDFASGAVHMLLDYRPCPPVAGLAWLFHFDGARDSELYLRQKAAIMPRLSVIERLVFDFKNHHPRPDALGRQSTLELMSATVLLGQLPLSLALNALGLVQPLPGWLMLGAVTFLVGGAFAQYFHGTLHRATIPQTIMAMRRTGLLMTPQAHAIHHETLRRDFATVSGWSNPLLNRIFAAVHRAGWLREEGLVPSH